VTGYAVFDARRNFGVDLAADQAFFFEIAQSLGQDLVRDVGHEAAQFVEAAHAGIKPIEADQAPLAADGIHGSGERAFCGRG